MPGLEKRLDKERFDMVNRRLEMAFQILENETCPGCGQPSWLTHSSSNMVMFDAFVTRCHGCRAKALGEKAHKDLKPYESLYVAHVPTVQEPGDAEDPSTLTPLHTRQQALREQEKPMLVFSGESEE